MAYWYFFNPEREDACLCGATLDDEDHHRKCRLDVSTYAKTIDLANKDKSYWCAVFKDMEEKRIGTIIRSKTILTSNNRLLAIQDMRKIRYDKRREPDRRRLSNPVRQYGVVIGTQIDDAIAEASKDKDCVDNERWARKRNSPDRRRYAKARKSGCCGFYDAEIIIDGETYLIGFNYGH